jgi:hypothetical protein
LRSIPEGFVSSLVQVPANNRLKSEMASETLRAGRRLHLRAIGWSMLPTIWPGDVLVVENAASQNPGRGDIMLFRCGDRLVAHRVVKSDASGSVVVQGDAVSQPDAALGHSDLMGKVISIQRRTRQMQPRHELPGFSRVVAGVLRRSEWMARALAAAYRFAQRSKKIFVHRVVPCQN